MKTTDDGKFGLREYIKTVVGISVFGIAFWVIETEPWEGTLASIVTLTGMVGVAYLATQAVDLWGK